MEEVSMQKKICILGDPGVGKTSLVVRFVYNLFDESYISTVGANVYTKDVDISSPTLAKKIKMKLAIWDLAGQLMFTDVNSSHYQGAEGALVVCDITRKKTFENISRWLHNFQKYAKNAPVIMLVNKSDMSNQKEVGIQDCEKFSSIYGSKYFLTSAKSGENVEEAFRDLCIEIAKKEQGVEKFSMSEDSLKIFEIISSKAGNYLIKEEKPEKSFTVYSALLRNNIKGLCIMRAYPKEIGKKYDLGTSKVIWLTHTKESEKKESLPASLLGIKMETTEPSEIDSLQENIFNFIEKNTNCVVLLEGIEYLIAENDFTAVLKFIHRITEKILVEKTTLILTINPSAIDEKNLKLLERECFVF
ncbi:MAG: DUF835 domain-containing protein [Candidatus Thermoplasmatota archaeon]